MSAPLSITPALLLSILERSDLTEDEARAGGVPEEIVSTLQARRAMTPPKARRYSPGTWSISRFIRPGSVVIRDANDRIIATVHQRDGSINLPMAANAQVMGASAEMVDALHELLDGLPTRGDMVRAIAGKETSESILARFDRLDATAVYASAVLLKAGARR